MSRYMIVMLGVLGLLGCGAPVYHQAETRAGKASESGPRTYRCRYTAHRPHIDGFAKDQSWNTAEVADEFHPITSTTALKGVTLVRMLWNEDNFYIAFYCTDDYLVQKITEDDGKLWEDDCFELIIDPTRSGTNYFEFEVTPRGTFADIAVKDRHAALRPADWLIGRLWKAEGLRKAVRSARTPTGVQEWFGEIAIPIRALSEQGVKPGVVWRFQLCRIDHQRDGRVSYATWSPAPDFHRPDCFAYLLFVLDDE